MPAIRALCLPIAFVCGISATAAQAPVVVTVREGSRVRAVARVDGAAWSATCDMPAGATAAPVVASRSVGTGVRERAELEAMIRRLFRDSERRENVSPAALASVPMQIESLDAGGQDRGAQVYFFRASKTIPDSRGDVDLDDDGEVDPPGELRVDVSGWLRRTAARVESLGTNVTLSWEQVDARPAAGIRRAELTPVGVADVRGTSVWVMHGRAGTTTWYSLYDVGAGGVRLLIKTDSPGC